MTRNLHLRTYKAYAVRPRPKFSVPRKYQCKQLGYLMSLKRHVCRLPYQLSATKDHIWISDDILDRALRQFSHTQTSRRHVSSIPGPLEARKRITRRRMVNLAQVNGVDQVDPGLLAGRGPPERRDWQWQSPGLFVADKPLEPPSLPQWLADFGLMDKNEDSLERTMKEPRTEDHQYGPQHDPNFMEELTFCESLQQLRSWATAHDVDLREHSGLAIQQLIRQGLPLKDLLQVMDDAQFRTLGNIYVLISSVTPSLASTEDLNSVHEWIKRHSSLGLSSEDDIASFSRSLCQLRASNVAQQRLKYTVAGSVFEGLRSSRVLGLNDLKDSILMDLFKCTCSRRPTRESQALGIEMIGKMQTTQLRKSERKIAQFLQRNIRAQAYLRADDDGILYQDAILVSIEIIRRFPRFVRNRVITTITIALIDFQSTPDISGPAALQLLSKWWSSLKESSFISTDIRNSIETILADTNLEIVASYLQIFDEVCFAQYVLRNWIASSQSASIKARLMHDFSRRCRNKEDESPFLHLLNVASERSLLTDDAMQRLFKHLQVIGGSEYIVEILLNAERHGVHIRRSVVLDTIKGHMSAELDTAIKLFEAYPHLALERCPELAERIIANRDLPWSLAFKLSKSQDPRTYEGYSPKETDDIKTQRAHLLGKMAVGYSKASHMSPRMAFTRVYRCYRHIIKDRLYPLPVEIITAFVIAGIIRPLLQGQWVSTVKFKWIHKLIQQLEGPETARRVDNLVYRWRCLVVKEGGIGRRQARPVQHWLDDLSRNVEAARDEH